MRTVADEDEVARIVEIGFAHLPEGDSEERTRLLMARAFRPFAAGPHRVVGDEELHASEDAGLAASDMAMRLGRPDLASASLDAAVTAPGNRADFGRMKAINAQRLALVQRLDDPFELGDIYAMNAWCDAFIGNLDTARSLAEQGVRVAGDSPTVVGCLTWLAYTSFCVGEWDRAIHDVQPEIERRLGERADSPPHFSVPAFGAAAFITDARSAPAAARYLEILRSWLGTTQGYSAGMVDAWLASILARRGGVDEASAILAAIPPNVRFAVSRPLIDAAAAYVFAASSAWDEAAAFLGPTREYAERAGLVALPAHLDRLEALLLASTGDTTGARSLLDRSAETFGTIGDRWNRALVDLDAAELLAAAGEQPAAAHRCRAAAVVVSELGSLREIERANALSRRLED